MSNIPDTLRRIAEQIATLEAERDRLLRELAAESSLPFAWEPVMVYSRGGAL